MVRSPYECDCSNHTTWISCNQIRTGLLHTNATNGLLVVYEERKFLWMAVARKAPLLTTSPCQVDDIFRAQADNTAIDLPPFFHSISSRGRDLLRPGHAYIISPPFSITLQGYFSPNLPSTPSLTLLFTSFTSSLSASNPTLA